MSTAGQFDDDAFISYGSIDNQHVEDREKGWVDNFHERLTYKLGERLGYRPKVWRDSRMPGNVYFSDFLGEKIAGTCVLVSVLSPGYINSAWCMGELKEFCALARSRGGLTTRGGRVRVFKVIKTHIRREQHPEELQGMRAYEFFEEDKESLRPVEFGQGLDRHYDQRYWNRLDELVWDIMQTLEELKPPRATVAPAHLNMPARPGANGAKKGSVYLAVTTSDLREQRDRIRFELLDRGFEVLPEGELPYASPDFEEAVRESLRRAKLSIHLIGERYGLIPEGAGDSSVVRLQNEIAAERCGETNFARIIWLPERLQPREQRQAQFIDYLKTNAQPQRGAELLQTTLEELKSVIRTRLTSTNGHRPPRAAAPPGGPRKVYLVCDRRDAQGMLPLYKSLTRRGYKVLLPLLEDEGADEAQADKLHWDNLRRCDAVLVYYGGARQDWFDYRLQDIEQLPTLERAGPLLARGVYVAAPSTLHKEIYEPNENEGVIVRNFGEFDEEMLEPFVAEMEAAAKGVEDAGQA